MKNKLILIISLCLSTITAATSQNLKTDLQKMKNAYTEAKGFQTEVDVKIYQEEKFIGTKKAMIKKTKENYFYTVDDISILLNEEYSVMINKKQKVIVFGKKEAGASDLYATVDQFKLEQMDSLFNKNKEWEFKGITNQQKHYTLKNKEDLISKTELFINEKNHTIQKVIFYYNEELSGGKNMVVINYKNTKINPAFSKDVFSETNYIKNVNGAWITTASYKDYDLINVSEEG